MSDDIIKDLSKLICSWILKNSAYQLGPDESLFSSGLIDSFNLVELALLVEDSFGVRLADTELSANTFDTVRQLAEIINVRQG